MVEQVPKSIHQLVVKEFRDEYPEVPTEGVCFLTGKVANQHTLKEGDNLHFSDETDNDDRDGFDEHRVEGSPSLGDMLVLDHCHYKLLAQRAGEQIRELACPRYPGNSCNERVVRRRVVDGVS
ncbi:hypothetical protein TWF694_004056 [Orbilia ellipsospora]|uniref:Uncharacterized protein n=1 Tax=Orbilia ellipsospora TaxID=2528407 RepID=A0AAV9WX79_9PEZI